MVAAATVLPSAAITIAAMKAKPRVDHPADVCSWVTVLCKPPNRKAPAPGVAPVGGVNPLEPPVNPPEPPRCRTKPLVEADDAEPPEALTSAEVIGLLTAIPAMKPTIAPMMVNVVDSEMNWVMIEGLQDADLATALAHDHEH